VLKMMLCNATTAAALPCIKFPQLHLLQPIIQDLRERPAVVEMRDVIHRPVQRIVHVAKIKLGVCRKTLICDVALHCNHEDHEEARSKGIKSLSAKTGQSFARLASEHFPTDS